MKKPVVSKKTTTWLRWILSLVLLTVLIYFFLPLIKEIKATRDLFLTAAWAWLPLAILVQLISYLFLTWLNVLALTPFSGKIGFWKLAGMLTATAFIQIAIPSLGASGVALRAHLLGKFGYKTEESLASLGMETITIFIAFTSVALLGIVYLLQMDQFSINKTLLIVISAIAAAVLLWLAWRLLCDETRRPIILHGFVNRWNRLAGRFVHIDYDNLAKRFIEFRDHLRHYREIPLWKFALATYGRVLLDILTLGIGFFLFRYEIDLGKLFTGYGLILTSSGIANLPGGLGMTDAYVPVIFSWLAVPGAVALAAGLIYRLIAYWLVRFIGFFCWQWLEKT